MSQSKEIRKIINLIENINVTEDAVPKLVKSANGAAVMLLPHVQSHIDAAHGSGNGYGQGSVFSKPISLDEIGKHISKITIDPKIPLYEIKISNIGYDLVLSKKEVMNLNKKYGGEKSTTKKTAGRETVDVNAFNVKASVEQLASGGDIRTNVLTIVIRQASEEHSPDEYKELAQNGKLFAVLTAWPGRGFIGGKEIPPAHEWGDNFWVIIPSDGSERKATQEESLSKQMRDSMNVIESGNFNFSMEYSDVIKQHIDDADWEYISKRLDRLSIPFLDDDTLDQIGHQDGPEAMKKREEEYNDELREYIREFIEIAAEIAVELNEDQLREVIYDIVSDNNFVQYRGTPLKDTLKQII